MKKIFYILTSLYILVWGNLKAEPIDSLQSIQIQKELAKQLETQMKQNEANDKVGKSHLNNYVIHLKANILSDGLKTTFVDEGDLIWDFDGTVDTKIQNFNRRLDSANGAKYYLVIASIYKFSDNLKEYNKDNVGKGIGQNSWSSNYVNYDIYKKTNQTDTKIPKIIQKKYSTSFGDFASYFKPAYSSNQKVIVDCLISFYIPYGGTNLVFHHNKLYYQGIDENYFTYFYHASNQSYQNLDKKAIVKNKTEWLKKRIQSAEDAFFIPKTKDPVFYYQYTLSKSGNKASLIRETIILDRKDALNKNKPVHFITESEDATALMRLKYLSGGNYQYTNGITLTDDSRSKVKTFISLIKDFYGGYYTECKCWYQPNIFTKKKTEYVDQLPKDSTKASIVQTLTRKDAFAFRMAFDKFPDIQEITLTDKKNSSISIKLGKADIQYVAACVGEVNNAAGSVQNFPYWMKMEGLTGGDVLSFIDVLKEAILAKASFGLEYFGKNCVSPVSDSRQKDIMAGATWDFAVETGLDVLFSPIEIYAALNDSETFELESLGINNLKSLITESDIYLEGNDCEKLYESTKILLGTATIVRKATKIFTKGTKIISEIRGLNNLKKIVKFSKKLLGLTSKSIRLNIKEKESFISPLGSSLRLADIGTENEQPYLAINEKFLVTSLPESYELITAFNSSEVVIKRMTQGTPADFSSAPESIGLYRQGNNYKWLIINNKEFLGEIATSLETDEISKLKNITLQTTDEYLDVVVHADDNNNYFVYLENAAGRLETINLTTNDIVEMINNATYAKDKMVRLLSCSNLQSAKQISVLIPDRIIIATDDIVRLHTDGGITTIARSGNATQKWRKLKAGRDIGEAPTPKAPEGDAVNNYIQLGSSLNDFDSTLHPAFVAPFEIDGFPFVQYEQKAVVAFYKKQDMIANGLIFLRKYRELSNMVDPSLSPAGQPKFVSNWLAIALFGQDVAKLKDVLKLIHPSISTTNKFSVTHKNILDKMVSYVGGTDKITIFDTLVANIRRDTAIFKKMRISTEKPAIFAFPAGSPNNPFDTINMQHIMDKHTLEHFQFTIKNLEKQGGSSNQYIDFFPEGTTQIQICNLLDEAIEKAKNQYFGGVLPTKSQVDAMNNKSWNDNVTLSNGKTYKIGFTTNSQWQDSNGNIPYAGKYIIGQFYPIDTTENRKINYLEILKDIL